MMRFSAPALLLLCVALCSLDSPSRAQIQPPEGPIDLETLAKERKRKQSQYPVNKRISRYLTAAAEKSDEDSPEEAIALLDRLTMSRLNHMERALVYRLRGYVAYASGDYPETIASFEAVLAEEVLRLEADNRIRFNIAQLYAAQQKWEEVIAAIGRWFPFVEEPDPLAFYLLGVSNYQLRRMDAAIENTEQAVDRSSEPPEGWLQLLAALYVQNEDYANATPVLEELVIRFPKKLYWGQLSLIYGARDDYRHSLAVQQVAHLQGLLTEDKELRRLVRSYLYHELPHPAAAILEKGIADGAIEPDVGAWEMLANSLIAAREYDRSLQPLRNAAEMSEDGKLLIRLGQVHLQREEWGEAAARFAQALEKGGLEKPGDAELLLGIAHYENESPRSARAAFRRARRHDESRKEASRWISHIDAEASSG